jgi:hypothetical protein
VMVKANFKILANLYVLNSHEQEGIVYSMPCVCIYVKPGIDCAAAARIGSCAANSFVCLCVNNLVHVQHRSAIVDRFSILPRK